MPTPHSEATAPEGIVCSDVAGRDYRDTSLCILLVTRPGSTVESRDQNETLLIAHWQCRTVAEPTRALAMALSAGLQKLARAELEFVKIEELEFGKIESPRTVHGYSPAQAQ